jgi:hypothetical protein
MAPGLLSRIPSSLAKRVGLQIGTLSPAKVKVAENFLALSSVQIANYLRPLTAVSYLIRVIGIEKYGLIAFAQSLIWPVHFLISVQVGNSNALTQVPTPAKSLRCCGTSIILRRGRSSREGADRESIPLSG